MKKILFLIGIVASIFVISGCDKPDYQHPSNRTSK